MSMTTRRNQEGLTLVMSLIMLMVLTLLVVSAIRFGNINLQIAGNAQSEAEVTAATQVALEQVIAQVKVADKIDEIARQPNLSISTGGKSYAVTVEKPACILTNNVLNKSLDPANAMDQKCFTTGGNDMILGPDGTPIATPTSCKDQQWDVEAAMAAPASEAKVTLLQGVSVRVDGAVQCP